MLKWHGPIFAKGLWQNEKRANWASRYLKLGAETPPFHDRYKVLKSIVPYFTCYHYLGKRRKKAEILELLHGLIKSQVLEHLS